MDSLLESMISLWREDNEDILKSCEKRPCRFGFVLVSGVSLTAACGIASARP
jgi:hypothetical protein